MTQPFVKSERQIDVCNMLNAHTHGLVYGGSRSGKTTIITRNIILRALKKKSRHLMCRYRFNHAKQSLWHDTLPKVLSMCFPEVLVEWNNSDFFLDIEAPHGGASQIWLGGVDDKDRVEKILGNEYSTIYANECSQISYGSTNMLRTRLAENSGLDLKFYYDLNPCGKKHWTYKEFVEGIQPETKKPIKRNASYLVLNPLDNKENLPPAYLEELENLPERERLRFLQGEFLNDIEGALWKYHTIEKARVADFGEEIETVVAIDPAVTNNEDSDETGIIVASKDIEGRADVIADLSGKMSTKAWAQRAVDAYYYYEANVIVAETNQGGDLVVDAIKSIDPNIKVVKVHASKGKFARAEPVSVLYEDGKVRHQQTGLNDLENQMTEYVPLGSKKSPDRLDALVWAITYLLLRTTQRKRRVAVYG